MSLCFSHDANSTSFRFRFQWVSSALRSYDKEDDRDNNDSYSSSLSSSPSQSAHSPCKFSAMYNEEKLNVVASNASDAPSDNRLTSDSLRSSFLKSSELSSSDSEEVEDTEQTKPIELKNELLAGDGNPIRHTFLSLVMEEDLPAIMEAMNESFHCEFVDLQYEVPSTSSILHSPETRKERRKARKVSSIRFEETNPKVYTYLDEISAIGSKEWIQGIQLDFETYQKISDGEVDEYKQSMTDKWKDSVSSDETSSEISQHDVTSSDDDREFNVGSPCFTYSTTHNETSTISV